MNFKKILLFAAVGCIVLSSCSKNQGVTPLTHLVISKIEPSSPRVDTPFTVTVEVKDDKSGNEALGGNTTVTLSLASGTGHLTGDLTATMEAPDNIVRFTNVRYDVVESGVSIKVTCTGGNNFTPAVSYLFTVTGPMLIFKFKFDSTQVRLNGFGVPTPNPGPGNAAQSPQFNSMSAHYIELAPTATTALGTGAVLYVVPTTTLGGDTSIDFDKSTKVGEGQVFFSCPLKPIPAGIYQWLRISLAYQNYDIRYKVNSPFIYNGTGTIASFIGYETYITNYKIKTQTLTVNADRLQGYWGFETTFPSPYGNYVTSGQAPPGATTVPNPLFASSPIPSGSCVVTGAFTDTTLVITGLTIPAVQHSDIVVTVSVSTNKSFEWIDTNGNGIFEPAPPENEVAVDMGVRGIIPIVRH